MTGACIDTKFHIHTNSKPLDSIDRTDRNVYPDLGSSGKNDTSIIPRAIEGGVATEVM